MWNDPFHSLVFSTLIPGEIQVSTEGGSPIAYVQHHSSAHDAQIQNSIREHVGRLHQVGEVTFEHDALERTQGYFEQSDTGTLQHHLPDGSIDYTVDSKGYIHDALGEPLGHYEQTPTGGTLHYSITNDEQRYIESFIAPIPVTALKPITRKPLKNWDPGIIQHRLDHQATDALGKVPGIGVLAKKFQEYGTARSEAVTLAGTGIRVSDKQLSPLFRLYMETAEILGVTKPPKLYVMPGGMNAYTFEAHEPFIVVHSGLISCFNDEEIRFTLGHELGHLLLGHVRYSLMASEIKFVIELVSQASFGIGGLVGRGIEFAILEWSRKAELSCDRVGMLAVQDTGTAAITALMKMSGAPPRFYQNLDIGAFIEQAREFETLGEQTISGMYKIMSNSLRDHPWTVARASELLKWIEAGGPQAALAGKPSPIDHPVTDGPPSAESIRRCPKCGSTRGDSSSMCWNRGCGDSTPFHSCPTCD